MENGINVCSEYLILYVEIPYTKLESILKQNEQFFQYDIKTLIDIKEVIETYT